MANVVNNVIKVSDVYHLEGKIIGKTLVTVVTTLFFFDKNVTTVTIFAGPSDWLAGRRQTPPSRTAGSLRRQPARGVGEAAARTPERALPVAPRACDSISPVVRSAE